MTLKATTLLHSIRQCSEAALAHQEAFYIGLLSITALVFAAQLPASSQPRPARLRCDDHVSYMITVNRDCIDLTVLTHLGNLGQTIATSARVADPVVANNLSIHRSRTGSYLVGELSNQSQRPVRLYNATFVFTSEVDGHTMTHGTVTVPVSTTVLNPGDREGINWLLPTGMTGAAQLKKVDYAEIL
jgi:hypothetical protein